MIPNQRKIRVLVVDDSAVIRAFLTKVCLKDPRIEVVGYATRLGRQGKVLRLSRCDDPGCGDAGNQRHRPFSPSCCRSILCPSSWSPV